MRSEVNVQTLEAEEGAQILCGKRDTSAGISGSVDGISPGKVKDEGTLHPLTSVAIK